MTAISTKKNAVKQLRKTVHGDGLRRASENHKAGWGRVFRSLEGWQIKKVVLAWVLLHLFLICTNQIKLPVLCVFRMMMKAWRECIVRRFSVIHVSEDQLRVQDNDRAIGSVLFDVFGLVCLQGLDYMFFATGRSCFASECVWVFPLTNNSLWLEDYR